MYKIQVKDFEGPLDLLIFFIKRDELNIYDIPISKILKDYIEYIHLIQKLDLDLAGEFIIMASILMQIKVRMLLPREVDESGKEIDPRDELVKRLLEYMRYKEMTHHLSNFEANRRKFSLRHYFKADESTTPHDFDVLLKNITLYDLTRAFKSAIDKLPKVVEHTIVKPDFSTEDQLEYITQKLNEHREIHFEELIQGIYHKMRLVVIFIVLLELVKNGDVYIIGGNSFNDFRIIKK